MFRTAPLLYHDIAAGLQPARLYIMFNDNVACRFDIAAGIDAANDINRPVHLQLARDSRYILPHNDHVGDDHSSVQVFKLAVQTGKIRDAVGCDGKALSL